MTAAVSSVIREVDRSGESVKSFKDAAGRHVQAFAFDPEVAAGVAVWSSTSGSAENTRVVKAAAGELLAAGVQLDAEVTTLRVSSTVKEVGRVVKASAGTLVGLAVTNDGGVDLFLQLHNLAALPTGGEVPVASIPIPAGGAAGFSQPEAFDTGITWVVSTDVDTFVSGGAVGFGRAQIASDRWLLVLDKPTAPGNGDVPLHRRKVVDGEAKIRLVEIARPFVTGIAVALSTTPDVVTLPAVAEGLFQIAVGI